MPSSSLLPPPAPRPSHPEPGLIAPSSPPRRLVVVRKTLFDREHERHERLQLVRAAKRARQNRRLASIAGGVALLAVALLIVRHLAFAPVWPGGRAIPMNLSLTQAPVSLGHDWFFPATNGTLWRVRNGQTRALWTGAFPASPLVIPLNGDLLLAGGDGALVRLDARGRKKWSGSDGTGINTRPVVVGNSIVGADDAGRLWARDANNGRVLWRLAPGASVGDGLAATPWGVVVPLLSSGTAGGGLRCVAVQTGKTLWTFPPKLGARAAGTATPRFDSKTNRVYWCNDSGAVVALDARTGSKIWKSFTPARGGGSANSVLLRASPVLVGHSLIVGGGDGGLRAFDARSGRALWTRWLGQPLDSSLQKARLNGRRVVLAGSAPAIIVDAANGAEVQRLGEGVVTWNRGFAGADTQGVWRFWRS